MPGRPSAQFTAGGDPVSPACCSPLAPPSHETLGLSALFTGAPPLLGHKDPLQEDTPIQGRGVSNLE